MNFAFDIEHRYSSVCEVAQSSVSQSSLKKEVIENNDQASEFDYMRNRKESGLPKEVAFTFFGPGKRLKETAIINCWPLEDDVLIGEVLRVNR